MKLRLQFNRELESDHQRTWGQYFTGAKLASWMASWFEVGGETVRLLDAGAGDRFAFGGLCFGNFAPVRNDQALWKSWPMKPIHC